MHNEFTEYTLSGFYSDKIGLVFSLNTMDTMEFYTDMDLF